MSHQSFTDNIGFWASACCRSFADIPFYCFLSGGAGVGKSHLIKALYQAAVKYYNTRTGIDFHQIKVIPLGPTGKAACNI